VGVGAVFATNDDGNRVRNPPRDERIGRTRWPLRATVFPLPRVGIGVEAMSLGTLNTVAASNRTFKQTDYEQESVVVATAHARVIDEGRVALEVIGGLGQLRTHRTFNTSHPASSALPTVFTEDSSMRALMTGVEMPIRALPHLSVGPSARIYFLRRPHHSSGGLNSRDSAIFMFGVIADVIW
jgi:hypothetical protein